MAEIKQAQDIIDEILEKYPFRGNAEITAHGYLLEAKKNLERAQAFLSAENPEKKAGKMP